MSDGTDRATIWMPTDEQDRIKSQLAYGDSFSAWMREAARFRLLLQDELERAGLELPDDETEREKLVRDILFAGVTAYADGDAADENGADDTDSDGT